MKIEKKNWSKEFDEEFVYNNHGKRYLYNDEHLERDIKDFISSLLSNKEKEIERWKDELLTISAEKGRIEDYIPCAREEAREYLKREIKDWAKDNKDKHFLYFGEEYKEGWNNALSDLISKISEL